jgi:5'-nucleotidase (lipoprotein e(P4) family)
MDLVRGVARSAARRADPRDRRAAGERRRLSPTRHRVAATLAAAALAAGALFADPASAQLTERDVHWVRDSAEHEALFLEVYHAAAARVDQLSSDLPGRTWAVILDADETILDNSAYYRRVADGEQRDDDASFAAWARRAASPALPGAAEFIAHVQSLGGVVVVVTNRIPSICEDTRRNLTKLELDVDAVLCRSSGSDDKDPRFDAVRNGTADPDLPPLDVLLWVGDNIRDFPHLTQAARAGGDAAFGDFGVRFFLLPNPMYGSWEGNPAR